MGTTNTNGAKNGPEDHRQDALVIPEAERPLHSKAHHPREGWEKQFAAMVQAGDDALLDDDSSTNTWDELDWMG